MKMYSTFSLRNVTTLSSTKLVLTKEAWLQVTNTLRELSQLEEPRQLSILDRQTDEQEVYEMN